MPASRAEAAQRAAAEFKLDPNVEDAVAEGTVVKVRLKPRVFDVIRFDVQVGGV